MTEQDEMQYKGPPTLKKTVERAYEVVRDCFSCENPTFEVRLDPAKKNDLRKYSECSYDRDEDIIGLSLKLVVDATDDLNYKSRNVERHYSYRFLENMIAHEMTHRELDKTTQWGIEYSRSSELDQNKMFEIAERLKFSAIQEGLAFVMEDLSNEYAVCKRFRCGVWRMVRGYDKEHFRSSDYAKIWDIPEQDYETSFEFFKRLAESGMSIPNMIGIARDILDEAYRDNRDAVQVLQEIDENQIRGTLQQMREGMALFTEIHRRIILSELSLEGDARELIEQHGFGISELMALEHALKMGAQNQHRHIPKKVPMISRLRR
jgi:hypothetical protein